jgi:hypothetical protein
MNSQKKNIIHGISTSCEISRTKFGIGFGNNAMVRPPFFLWHLVAPNVDLSVSLLASAGFSGFTCGNRSSPSKIVVSWGYDMN